MTQKQYKEYLRNLLADARIDLSVWHYNRGKYEFNKEFRLFGFTLKVEPFLHWDTPVFHYHLFNENGEKLAEGKTLAEFVARSYRFIKERRE